MVEAFVPGRELTVGILDGPGARGRRNHPASTRFSTTNASIRPGMSQEIFPADLPDEVRRECRPTRASWPTEVLKLGGYSRVDFRLTPGGELVCLEVNTLPGMTSTSLMPQSAAAVGIPFPELCERICLASRIVMSEDRPPLYADQPKLTPWVGRLMVANAVVLLLLQTVLTAPVVRRRAAVPAANRRFAVPGLSCLICSFTRGSLHPAGNMLLLFAFGPPVERRMGSRAFLLFYLYCGVGAAALRPRPLLLYGCPAVGRARGGVLGVGLAFAFAWPEAELVLFPLPLRITARTLILLLAGVDLLLALWTRWRCRPPRPISAVSPPAISFFGFRASPPDAPERARRRSPAGRSWLRCRCAREARRVDLRPAMARPDPRDCREEYPAEEVDRVLDKISALGIQSLTAEERRFLDEVSKRKRKDA